ncbi:hypothetical protein [Wolbachia endosymbiont of Ctenocephalides felis wCfeJ]|uniref:hypothetical protein n=1 Tax=Wolbachia endosymbiont of Ctenocephalides felis wCfeJ TaxID=2732594 RepID=UPI001447A44B|nr:hypothetical protein [Wolbachia endosymbiont of Ctenocephalides felis wCfeJ]WCR57557.1 MAG: hypothetical protein PG980_000029 [Wolbachia endosymbiont of Ctenocephalides felis wCfeJ]
MSGIIVGKMNKKELVEKISLILVEADSEGIGKEALEIINKLKKHINDNIIIDSHNSKKLTALDCVIIADSQGNQSKLSERPRIENKILKELESAIRDAGGKTSEELGRTKNILYIQTTNAATAEQARNGRLRCVRNGIIKKVIYGLCVLALSASSCYLIEKSKNDNTAESSKLMGIAGVVGLVAAVVLIGISPALVMGRNRRDRADVESVTVESGGRGR